MLSNRGNAPGERWQLTAPESYVLHYGAYEDSGVEAFKLAVKELVLRRALLVEQAETRRILRRGATRSALREGPRAETVREPPLTIVLGLHRRLAESRRSENGAVPMRSFVRAAQKQFAGQLRKYRDPWVVRALARRELVKQANDPLARMAPRKRWFRTDAGDAANETLERWLAIGRHQLRRWVRDDPSQALAYAGGAGASILLLNHLHGVELVGLSRRVQEYAGSGGEGLVPFVPEGGSEAEGPAPVGPAGDLWPGQDSLSELDFGAFDFGALDGIGAVFGAFDVGGGGGGGDGGGGG